MFRFFSRKSAPTNDPFQSQIVPDSQDTDSIRNQQLRTPSPSATSAVSRGHHGNASPLDKATPSGPPITPSPPLVDPLLDNNRDAELGLITDPTVLHALISSVPPKILHEYTLKHLIPPTSSRSTTLPIHPPSSLTLTHLTSFFSSLTPPPRLHCVRCHKSYYEVENDDRSCLVPHDDDSAEVEKVGSAYETLWGCCGKTVEGDGDMGPPDGWCYEGKHTTDTKRARFRADSTIHHDKLTSCEKMKCFEPPVSSAESDSDVGASPRPRKRKRSTRKRAQPTDDGTGAAMDEDDDDAQSVISTRSKSSTRPRKKPKTLANLNNSSVPPSDPDALIPTSPVIPVTPAPASASASASASTPTSAPPKPKPRKKKTKATHDDKAFKPESTPVDDGDDMDVDDSASVASTKKKMGRPKKSAAKTKPFAVPQSMSAPGTPSIKSASPTRESGPSGTRTHRPSVSFSATTQTQIIESISSSSKQKLSAGMRPKKTKKLEEVVATSVEGEE
ncbi:hypothetical protein D9758_004276 [Tetrapyrgos nigripes]|uniref:Uncharacterized protein n=1 Tax=Tetrapyrgos nigripes TaxID=182062 RepID=A0A8H5GUP7_9AGAR|nr:hypothetical protein D9758_004276 [Tetrapyrgos nigripes]